FRLGLRLRVRGSRRWRLRHGRIPGACQSLPQTDLPRPADVIEEMTRHLPGVAVAAELERCRARELPGHRPDPVPPWQILLKRVDEPERVTDRCAKKFKLSGLIERRG